MFKMTVIAIYFYFYVLLFIIFVFCVSSALLKIGLVTHYCRLCVCVSCVSDHWICIDYPYFVCLVFSIFYFHRRIMPLVYDSFCGCRLGCADCAFESWSDLAKVIGHDHCEIMYRDFGRDCMMLMIFCCCHYGSSFYSESNKDRRDSAFDVLPL
jgi:hypothetical protein